MSNTLRIFKVGDVVKDKSVGTIHIILSIKKAEEYYGRCKVTISGDKYSTEYGSANFVKFGEYNNEVGKELMREVVL